MILNLYGQTKQNNLYFELPNIILDRRVHYQVGVHRVYLDIMSSSEIVESFRTHDLLMVTSNLVDRSASNPQQALVYFDVSKRDKFLQSYCSRGVIFHPLQMHELANASFNICYVNGEPAQAIYRQIFLQIEITRSQSYGWI